GTKCSSSAYTLSHIGELTEVKDFWARYESVGRCAVDPDHSQHFLNSDSRFLENPSTRKCTWCGQEQILHRWVEQVVEEEWKNLGESSPTRKTALPDGATMEVLEDGHWIGVCTRAKTEKGMLKKYREMCRDNPK